MDNNEQKNVEIKTNRARWYVVYVHSGCENAVKTRLEEKIKKLHAEDSFEEILIPKQDIVDKAGKKTEKKFFPGYVLIRMVMTDDTWHMVRDIPLVSGFLGARTTSVSKTKVDAANTNGVSFAASRATPISDKDAEALIHRLESKEDSFVSTGITFEVGDQVKVCEGPFASFNGTVEKVDDEKQRVKVSVSIFGRPTQVDLEFTQVEKL